MTDSEKLSSVLQYLISYARKKFYSTGPAQVCTIQKKNSKDEIKIQENPKLCFPLGLCHKTNCGFTPFGRQTFGQMTFGRWTFGQQRFGQWTFDQQTFGQLTFG